jgi:hypothetical protein
VKWIAVAGMLLSGCLYLDPINRRPSIGIDPQSSGVIRRGATVTFGSSYYDPEGQPGSYAWSAFACGKESDARQGLGCDKVAFFTGTQPEATLVAPVVQDSGAPVESVRIALEARDDRGALAQTLQVYPVIDGLPTLELRRSAHSFVVDAPIQLFARYGDPDDGPDRIALAWKVFTPTSQPAYTLTDLAVVQDVGDPAHRTAGKTLVPHGLGEWEIQVTASDPLGATADEHVMLTVEPDRPPCLAQWQPIAPPPGASLPITEPTVFQIPLVDDDLDGYPALTGDPVYGTATFAWSILPPGTTARQILAGATGNSIDFDPAGFAPGQIVELRVEVFDRNHTAIPCADELATCPVVSRPACTQRQTWRLEVR